MAALNESSSSSRVDAVPCFSPSRTAIVNCWSYCTRFVVIVEFAKRVPARSPPSKLSSTASALAMFRTLSVSALISSRGYIGGISSHTYSRQSAGRGKTSLLTGA